MSEDSSAGSDALRTAVLTEQKHLLDAAMTKFRHCVHQLSDEQLWWRPADDQNSIANLILHVCGNLTQWITCGVGGAEDRRDRAAEFSAKDEGGCEELWRQLETTVATVKQVIDQTTIDQLLTPRDIQGFAVTGLGAICHSVTHFVGHTHQVIQLTRLQLRDDYKFEWSPDGGRSTLPI